MSDPRDYRDTVFLPKTDFPMKAGLPQKEPAILARWREMGLYEKLRDQRRGREKFIFHDGPPYANGDMHIGHALNHILKDMVVRTQTLLGKDAPYVPGWDCHGLPIEWKVEEQYRKKKLNKDEVPPAEFRAECRAYAQHWVDTQREQLKRLGVNADWDNPYLTMDFDAEATIVSELMKFAESGQLYRGAKPVMWSPVEKTALAEAEIEYEDVVSTQVDVAFEIVESPIPELVGAHAVIWTTTPWTIPVNQAIAYGPDVEYVLVTVLTHQDTNIPSGGQVAEIDRSLKLLLAEPLRDEWEARTGIPLLGRENDLDFVGRTLAGTIARHPMAKLFDKPLPFRGGDGGGGATPGSPSSDQERTDSPHPNPSPEGEGLNIDPVSPLAEFFTRPRPFLPGDFVTTESGTGLVHMAPDHGEDDFDLCKANGLDPVFAVEGDGKYRDDWAWLGGQGSVINAKFNSIGGPILQDLTAAGALLAYGPYPHSYPHSWRSKAKVIYRCTPQWFVAMDSLKPLPFRGGVGVGDVNHATAGSVPLDTPHPNPSPEGEGLSTLRTRALSEIARVRFVPEKGRNRIGSMVEGRPDWVLSRQRAWGVPITLFVNRKSGQYLVDGEVNARIVAAVKRQGVDAWTLERAQQYLGTAYDAEDYEQVTDILDVWFDSGCTHAFVLESGRWPDQRWPADLYLEGSDQHRGWFQSSLLESCATRGRAPYDAVLTHGFTMDAKGLKMSKSLGNTIDPLKIMQVNGADIIRLWALSVDFTEDHRIGDEILKGVSDQYRKLRNSFRYLLGALDGFSEDERVDVADMPELERYILHLLAEIDGKLRQAVADYDFNSYVRLITDFANNDLSAFFFDIRKDSLYCDAADSPKRMAYRTVLDILFHALVRYAAPVLVFTAEEVWQTRYPDEAESVHFLDWPELPDLLLPPRHPGEGRDQANLDTASAEQPSPGLRRGDEFEFKAKWNDIRTARRLVTEAIEPLRRDKTIGSSLEAEAILTVRDSSALTNCQSVEMEEICITASCQLASGDDDSVLVTKTTHHKCGRCWRHLPKVSENGTLCTRCKDVVNA